MSKNITIQEGGVAKQLTVDKLKTGLVGGGDQLWVPEDEVQLTTKHISENGTYKASTDGYYGYSEVTVNGVGTASGKNSDGNDVVAHTDPSTGELYVDVVPDRIKVITPPYLGLFTEGEAIVPDSMVVKAYIDEDTLYDTTEYPDGVIPNDEITLSPATAVYDPSTVDSGGESNIDDTTGLDQAVIDALPIPYGTEVIGGYSLYETGLFLSYMGDAIVELTHTEPVYTFAIDSGDSRNAYACSAAPFSGVAATHNPGGDQHYMSNFSSRGASFNGRTFYWSTVLGSGGWNFLTPQSIGISAVYVNEIAYVILFGTRTEVPAGSKQLITASWERPYDFKVLETTFIITVSPSPSAGSGD